MSHRVKIRGIYTTALTKLLLNSGYTIIDPSPEIQERFQIKPTKALAELFIQDREDHQGVILTGEVYQLTLLVRLLQETLFDAILLEFAINPGTGEGAEGEEGEPKDIARSRFEFPGVSKAYLDAIRSTVTPTVANHHRLRAIQPRKVERFEDQRLAVPENKARIEKDLFAEIILAPLQKCGMVRLEHIKASGKSVRPREGLIIESHKGKLVMKRSFTQGRYDGLDLPIEAGDYALTEAHEGSWYVKHAYYSKSGELKGEYFNINTPVEFYPFGARYVDLEIDVIRRVGAKPVISDREELALLAQKGVIGSPLEKKAVETAESLVEQLGG